MISLRILGAADFERLVGMPEAVEAVDRAYRFFSRGEAGVFPVIVHQFEAGKREMDLKSGHVSGAGVFGMKMLGWCSENPSRQLPSLAGLIVLMDVETQRPLGIIDGTPVTGLRTGAAGAVGARTLARQDSRKALIVGAGNQGRVQLRGLGVTMPGLESIDIVDIAPGLAERFVSEQQKLYPEFTLRAVPFEGLGRAASEVDLIVTCTRSREPFLKREWIRPGTHINAIGADMPGKQECDVDLVTASRLFSDATVQVLEKGECQHAGKRGLIEAKDITEIGAVLEGKSPGRSNSEEITLFDATGMAIQDLIVGALALERAGKTGAGTLVSI